MISRWYIIKKNRIVEKSNLFLHHNLEAYLEPSRTSKIELCAKIVNDLKR